MSASSAQHRTFSNPCLPFVTNSSPTSADPQFVDGQNILTSITGVMERRGGFADVLVANPWVALARVFFWRKWGGTFFVMYCDISNGVARVYKQAIGADASASLIWSSATAEPFDFVVFNNVCYFGNGTDMKRFVGSSTADTTVTSWGLTAPAVPTIGAMAGTGINAQTGYYYCTTEWDSVAAHESSPSPVSACTGTFTNKYVPVSWSAPTNPRTTHVRVYRTTDGGQAAPEVMREITGSPFLVATTSVNDATLDANLSTRTAPAAYQNDPPPASKGFVTYGGRIWMFTNASTWATGQEEISNGVPQECVPGETLGIYGGGNVWNWDQEVNAHAPMSDGVAVFLANRIWKIEGTTLDTFQYYLLLEERGSLSRTAVTALGGSVAWLDTASQVWLSDLGEIGLPIRPSIKNIDHTQAWLTIHIAGTQHWLLLLDGANGNVYPFDLDTRQWMPPWNVGTTASAMASGRTAISTKKLALARNATKVLSQNSATYVDDNSAYAAFVTTSLVPITPLISPFSQTTNPEWRSVVPSIELKSDSSTAPSVKQVNDDDPSLANWAGITAITRRDPDDVVQGTNLKINRYPSAPSTKAGRMAAIRLDWPEAATNFKLYDYFIGVRQDTQ